MTTAVAEPKTTDQAPKAPPSKRAAKKAAPAKPPADKAPVNKGGRPSNDEKLRKQLADKIALYMGMAAAGAAGGQLDAEGIPARGTIARDLHIIGQASDNIAEAVVRYSHHNKALRTALEGVNEGGDLVALVMALATGIALPIMANHGMLPEQYAALLGFPPIETPTDAPS